MSDMHFFSRLGDKRLRGSSKAGEDQGWHRW
jgi:hypothetical protein